MEVRLEPDCEGLSNVCPLLVSLCVTGLKANVAAQQRDLKCFIISHLFALNLAHFVVLRSQGGRQ